MRDINWVTKCTEFLNKHEKTAFNWGTFDCCLFTADWVKIQFGIDVASEYRGHYTTETGSVRALKRYGAKTTDLKSTWSFVLDMKPTQGLAASRGDVVLVKQTSGIELIGVCFGNSVFAVSTQGLIRLPISQVVCHWKLGVFNG